MNSPSQCDKNSLYEPIISTAIYNNLFRSGMNASGTQQIGLLTKVTNENDIWASGQYSDVSD